MAESLDSIVKGAPAGSTLDGHDLAKSVGTSPIASSTTGKAGDPLNHTPSSPSMIYLNLLILEASLRAQYLELRARRRHHTFFLTLLTLWTAGFGYALFLAPREDGRGMGGSVYWMVESTEKLCFLGGIVTGILVWAVGIWDRGVRWPRRWLAVSNRGLRAFNCKLVVVKRPWWRELLGTIAWFLTYGLFTSTGGGGSSYRFVEPAVLREVDREMRLSAQNHPSLPILVETGADEEKGGHEEDLAPGGDYVKLLLLPKPFSPTFRENWELYRTEYWERENERRAVLRGKIQERDRRLVRQQGGMFWSLPWRRAAVIGNKHRGDPEKTPHLHHHHPHSRQAALVAEHRRPRSNSGSARRASTSTGSNSRSTTPTLEVEEANMAANMSRKSSTASNTGSGSDKRRKRVGSSSLRGSARPRVESRSITPENPSPLARGSIIGGGIEDAGS